MVGLTSMVNVVPTFHKLILCDQQPAGLIARTNHHRYRPSPYLSKPHTMSFFSTISSWMPMNASIPISTSVPNFKSNALHRVELGMPLISNLSIHWILASFVVSLYLISQFKVHFGGPKAPLVGLRHAFESRYYANWRFFRNAASVLNDGYAKVGFKSAYVERRLKLFDSSQTLRGGLLAQIRICSCCHRNMCRNSSRYHHKLRHLLLLMRSICQATGQTWISY